MSLSTAASVYSPPPDWQEPENEDPYEDDDNDSPPGLKKAFERAIHEIEAGSLNLTDNKCLARFEKCHLQNLTPSLESEVSSLHSPTALHLLADKLGRRSRPVSLGGCFSDDQLRILVTSLVRHDSDPLGVVNDDSKTALHLAIDEGHEKLAQWMCEAHPNINAVFSNPSQAEFCLHLAWRKKLGCFSLMVQLADAKTLALKDKNGNSLLHLVVEYKRCTAGQLQVVQNIASRCIQNNILAPNGDFNKNGESPFLHHQATVKEAVKEARRTGDLSNGRKNPDGSVGGRSPGNATDPASYGTQNPSSGGRVQTPGKELDSTFFDIGLDNNGAGDQSALGGNSQDDHMFGMAPENRFTLINADGQPEGDIFKFEASLGAEAPSPGVQGRPPASPLLRGMQNSATSRPKGLAPDGETVKQVENFLKLYYLRNRSHDACLEIFYGKDKVQDVEVNFDLTGRSAITKEDLAKLMQKLHFESALQYVNIPNIRIECQDNAVAAQDTGQGSGRVDFVHIFDSLREAQVDTILRVMVDDCLPAPHSDEAIEKCLEDFHVEELNWKRPDLSSEVIFKAAPDVEVVHLVSTGSEAVLRCWSGSDGLKKLKRLKKVTLTVQRGIETTAQTTMYLSEFRRRFEASGIMAELVIDDSRLSHFRPTKSMASAPMVIGDAKTPPSDIWLKSMEAFRNVIMNIKNAKTYKAMMLDAKYEVTVALIDDGVDGELDYPTYGGQSVFKQRGTNMSYPYYQSGSGHGTQMAKLITRICPVAKLFVVRLKDHEAEGHGGSRQIDAESAAAAIQAAVKRKVQIISMSWTIEPPSDEKVTVALREAIISANNANILMFCSASDQGALQTETYPKKATKSIFTIGAAKPTGHINSHVGSPHNVDYVFPGHRIDLSKFYPDAPQEEVTGSSAATALAAGFAALIYHCARIRWLYFRQMGNTVERESALHDLEHMHRNRYDVMNEIFRSSMWGGKNDDYKYLQVWRVFTNQVCDDREQLVKAVADIGKRLGESARKTAPPSVGS